MGEGMRDSDNAVKTAAIVASESASGRGDDAGGIGSTCAVGSPAEDGSITMQSACNSVAAF
jgi:hypothetical protein